jgi:hypothetical protein
MGSSIVKWILTRLLPGVALCAALGGVAWWLHHAGYTAGDEHASNVYDTALAQKQSAWDTERRQLAESNQQALQTALAARDAEAERGRTLALALQEKQTALELAQRKLSKQEIENATLRDGAGYTGIGPDSLRLYLTGLGYPGDDQPRSGGDAVSEAADRNAIHSTDARTAKHGLTPQALLSHIKRYGQWCLTLRNKLESLNEYYDGDRNEP